MKKFKPVITLIVVAVAVTALSITSFASTFNKTPAKVVAEITGRTVENVVAEKIEKKVTYGTIAKDAGKLEEFKEKVLEAKKEILNEKVASKDMTQDRADKIIANIEKNQATCDGTGSAKTEQALGAGFGNQNKGNSDGTGTCDAQGTGECDGTGQGTGLGDGQGTGQRNGDGTGQGSGQGAGQGNGGLRDGSCQE
ncbi:MAG: hypothetical protein WC677_05790 [Clostridia bacterium]